MKQLQLQRGVFSCARWALRGAGAETGKEWEGSKSCEDKGEASPLGQRRGWGGGVNPLTQALLTKAWPESGTLKEQLAR